MSQQSRDERWMQMALSLGQRGLGRTWPNPSVGCVLVRKGRVVGRGWTQPGGRPHGEVMALNQAGARARGATAYVTLEPCAHTGKSPPCASALISAGVSRVVSALQDPDPRVSGKGHIMLEQAGIAVTTGILERQAQRSHIGFLTRVTQNRPAVTLKLAASLDGRIATNTGDSRWITGPMSRRYVHLLRATHDAVMIGSGTALADDPDLTVRSLGLADRSPVRVILDSKLRTPGTSQLAKTAAKTATWIFHSPEANSQNLADTALELFPGKLTQNGQIDLPALLAQLANTGITRLFVEGGGTLAASLIRQNLVDELLTFTAGVAIGGDGRAQLAPLGIDILADAPRFHLRETRQLGQDILNIWHPLNTPT